jgi:hypothetical protein
MCGLILQLRNGEKQMETLDGSDFLTQCDLACYHVNLLAILSAF